MRGKLALAALLLAASPAAAQTDPRPIEEAAADLAYGYCPLFLAGQFALTGNPRLAELGFADTVETRQHPRFGELHMVSAKRADGEVGFGGVEGKLCSVVVIGARRDATVASFKANKALMGLDFQPQPVTTPPGPDITIENFKAPAGDQFLYLQLIDARGDHPAAIAQLFVTDK